MREENEMRQNRTGWCVIAVSAAVIGFAPAVFAEGNTHNGLSAGAFRRNALTTNGTALGKLLGHALNDAFVADDYIRRQLHDPNAKAMMEEIIRCALNASSTVKYREQPNG